MLHAPINSSESELVNGIEEGKQANYQTGQVAAFLRTSDTTIKNLVKEYKIDVGEKLCGAVKRRLFDIEHVYELAIKRALKNNAQRKPPKIVMVWNRKGGVGKTTVTRELACVMQFLGQRVLVIDIDPQNNLSRSMGYSVDVTEENHKELGVPKRQIIKYHLGHLLNLPPYFHGGKDVDAESLIKKPFGEYGPHLICATESIDEVFFAIERESFGVTAVRRMIMQSLQGKHPALDLRDYDTVLIDCNPMRTSLINALYCASTHLLIPVSLDAFSLAGVDMALDLHTKLHEQEVEHLPTPLILGNKFKSYSNRCNTNYQQLLDVYGPEMTVNQTISESEKVVRWQSECLHVPYVFRYPSDPLTSEFYSLADELLERMSDE